VLERWSLPPATPNLFVWGPLMARARELGVDVMLDGEGGDELFAYSPYLIADMLRSGRVLAAWRLTRRIPEIGAGAGVRMRLRAMRVFGVRRLIPPALKRRGWTAADSPRSLLLSADAVALEVLEDARHADELDGPLWWRALAGDLTQAGDTLGVAGHLRRGSIDDRIDQRHPFLFDLELLHAVLANPPEMQFDPVRDRALLRDAMTGQIPEAVRTRHAKSFFTDLLSAGLVTDGALLADGPSQIDAPVRAFVRPESLEQLLRESSQPRDIRAARRLWHVGLADVWLRALERPEYPRELLGQAMGRV
jgi:asparagine synthetase B (glutamine-hydrolysing)